VSAKDTGPPNPREGISLEQYRKELGALLAEARATLPIFDEIAEETAQTRRAAFSVIQGGDNA
jgi:hypothetical protein